MQSVNTVVMSHRDDITTLNTRLQLAALHSLNYANNVAALAAGLVTGDLYHTDGILKIVI